MAEFQLLKELVQNETHKAHAWVDFIQQSGLRKRCIIGWLTMFGAQGTATLVINSTYSAYTWSTVD